MNKTTLAGLLALAAGAMPAPNAEALAPHRPPRPSGRRVDPDAERRREHLEARTFVAADGLTYPVGPCGFVPRSAKFDPARRRAR